MFKAVSITAGAFALALTLSGCVGGAPTLTLKDAQSKIKAANISCTKPETQPLSDVMPKSDGKDVKGDLLLCQDDASTFSLILFDNPKDLGALIKTACDAATSEDTITQLKETKLLWGANWYADASSNTELYADLQKALGGENADVYSKCSA